MGDLSLRAHLEPKSRSERECPGFEVWEGAGKRARVWAESASMAGTWPQAWHSPSLLRPAVGDGPLPTGLQGEGRAVAMALSEVLEPGDALAGGGGSLGAG